jgi:hypothetical protein
MPGTTPEVEQRHAAARRPYAWSSSMISIAVGDRHEIVERLAHAHHHHVGDRTALVGAVEARGLRLHAVLVGLARER